MRCANHFLRSIMVLYKNIHLLLFYVDFKSVYTTIYQKVYTLIYFYFLNIIIGFIFFLIFPVRMGDEKVYKSPIYFYCTASILFHRPFSKDKS
jgi:hypothetical protein